MLVIHVFMKINPQHRERFFEKSRIAVQATNAEEGCLAFRFYEDPEQPNSFVLLEKWKDQQALDSHMETAHYKTFIEEIKEMVTEPTQADVMEVVQKS